MSPAAGNEATASVDDLAAGTAATRARPPASRRHVREARLLALVAASLVAALAGARLGRWTAGSDLGYGLGLAGGIGMLLLFLYPLRKRIRRGERFGHTRTWFAAHMVLGIASPLLVILHSRLSFGSLNATVAFGCMALVASSGVVGRFLYARIHHGLYGEKATLADLHAQAIARADAMHAMLGLAPEVLARLDAFAKSAEASGRAGLAQPVAFLLIGLRGLQVRRACRAAVIEVIDRAASAGGWSADRRARRLERRLGLVDAYVATVQRLAQFAVFERLFSWWHVLHVPLVWLLVASAVAHVVAVHMY
jgi:hypothetical protein